MKLSLKLHFIAIKPKYKMYIRECTQEIRSSNPPVDTGICDPNKSRARHHRSLKLGSKLKYLNIDQLLLS